VLVLTVAPVDDPHVRYVTTDLQGRSAGAVAHHDGVDAQRVDGAMVSRSDSPFFTLLDATANESTSALRRLAAVSKN